MNEVNVFNETNFDIEELKVMEKMLEYACKKENLSNTSFNVIIVDNNYIHDINKKYRGIDKETDVISFALEDEDTIKLPDDMRILGDIYISIEKVEEQAKEYGHSKLRELCFLAIHGFYHLLGYDHMSEEEEKIMFKKQEEVLVDYGIKK